MHRRRFLAVALSAVAAPAAGCLSSADGTVFDISPASNSLVAEAEVDLDPGEYELRVTFERFAPGGDGIDEEYVRGAVSTDDYGETVAELEVTQAGATSTTAFEIEDEGPYVGTLQAPTTESEARATLVRR